jgi:hypothetical protein
VLAQLDNETMLQSAIGSLEDAVQCPTDALALAIKNVSPETPTHSFP